jgi:hypothetical protein
MPKASRKEVYLALDSERAYQAIRWNRDTTATGGVHESLGDWLMYMDDYLAEAKHVLSRAGEPEATDKALHILRKVTALGVAAMEALGAPQREGYEQHFVVAQEEAKGPGLSSYHSKHGK